MSVPLVQGGPVGFRDQVTISERCLALQKGADLMSPSGFPGGAGEVCWDLWLDPGEHTGLGAVTYYRLPLGKDGDVRGRDAASAASQWWSQRLLKMGLEISTEALLRTWEATGAIVLSLWGEFLSGDEYGMVSTAIDRVRSLGRVWAGSLDWDFESSREGAERGDSYGCGLGPAGVGCERFVNLRAERTAAYLSPVRVTAAFDYALADEFGLSTKRQSSADMAATFGPGVLKSLLLYRPGPDHVRDAIGHALLAIRKSER